VIIVCDPVLSCSLEIKLDSLLEGFDKFKEKYKIPEDVLVYDFDFSIEEIALTELPIQGKIILDHTTEIPYFNQIGYDLVVNHKNDDYVIRRRYSIENLNNRYFFVVNESKIFNNEICLFVRSENLDIANLDRIINPALIEKFPELVYV
jgi:hypothetical protein